jgi:hypothetical protein
MPKTGKSRVATVKFPDPWRLVTREITISASLLAEKETAMATMAVFSGEQVAGNEPGGAFFIYFLDTPRGKIQLYIPYSGHKHFSRNNQMATLVNAVQQCAAFMTDAANGVDFLQNWNKHYEQNDVRFICRSGNDVGRCIVLFHSDSRQVYKADNYKTMQQRFNEPPRYGQM